MATNIAAPYAKSYKKLPKITRLSQVSQEDVSQRDDQSNGKKIRGYFCTFVVVIGWLNLAFIVPDLVFAYQGSTCVLSPVQGFSFNLSTWLQVDAYLRISVIIMLFIVVIALFVSLQNGLACALFVICLMLIYGMFSFIWTIIGSVMFWGRLNPTGVCTGPVQAYMYALLIITYISSCCNCLFSLKFRKN